MGPLETVAQELRDFASRAHGNPPTVSITARTLLDYAEAIERQLAKQGDPL
jgi:hypothetical protein